MGGNAQKTPFLSSINEFAGRKIGNALQIEGKALPCSVVSIIGSIVVVKFELTKTPFTLPNTMMPVVGSEYVRLPIQVGCKGVAFPADARIGGMSGLGGGTADLSPPGNLAALTFFPIGNKGWTVPENPNQLELYGPDGVLLKTANKDFFIQVSATQIALQSKDGSISIVVSASGIASKGTWTHTGAFSATTVSQGTVTLGGHWHAALNAPPLPGH